MRRDRLSLRSRTEGISSFTSFTRRISSEDLAYMVKDRDDLGSEGDMIFKVHSAGAAIFGSTLLLAPDVIIQSGPIAAFAYQQWSLFILAVAYITYNAPSLNKDAKTLLSNAYFGMCSAEAVLYLFEISRTLFRTPFNILIVDLSSLVVFSLLAFGYWRSGNTSLNRG